MSISKKMTRFLLLTCLIVILVLGYFKFETVIFSDVVDTGIRVRSYSDHVVLSGAVRVDSVYLTRAVYELIDRELRVSFMGFKINASRIEGEYYYELDVNRDDYDTIIVVGNEKTEEFVIYSK